MSTDVIERLRGASRLSDPQTFDILLREAPLDVVADLVVYDWGIDRVNYAAKPYLAVLVNAGNYPADANLRGELYGADTMDSVVRYFLVNARGWRGRVAKAVKAELNRRIA